MNAARAGLLRQHSMHDGVFRERNDTTAERERLAGHTDCHEVPSGGQQRCSTGSGAEQLQSSRIEFAVREGSRMEREFGLLGQWPIASRRRAARL